MVASFTLALLSEGGYHDDALTHYLYARWAWHDAKYLVDEWGRPGQTCLLLPFAWFGWTACRLASGLLSAASVWLAWDAARQLGLPRAAWVPLLCLVQPLFLVASSTTLTETIAAFYLMLALWCLLRNRPVWSAAAVSLCFVTRYETCVFLPLWALALRRCGGGWVPFAALLWAPVVHNLAGFALLERWPVEFIIGAGQPAYYGAGTPLTMLVKSLVACGPPVAILALGGLTARWPGPRGWLTPALYATYLAAHSVIFAAGAYASGGYPRFLVVTSPVAAICAAAALGAITRRTDPRHRWVLAAVLAVVVVAVLGTELETGVVDEAWLLLLDRVRLAVWFAAGVMATCCALMLARSWRWPIFVLGLAAVVAGGLPLVWLIRPQPLAPDARAMRAAARWLADSPYAGAPVVAANIWASHFLDRGRNVVPPPAPDILAGLSPGTVFLWDANHSIHARYGITAERMRQHPDWRMVWQSDERLHGEVAGRIYVREEKGVRIILPRIIVSG